MAKVCSRCGRTLKLFSYQSKDGLCDACEREQKIKITQNRKSPEQINRVLEMIATSKAVNDSQYAYLESLEEDQKVSAFSTLVDRLLADGELDDKESELLENIFKNIGLDPDNPTLRNKVMPSLYVTCIRHENALVTIPREPLLEQGIIIKKDEIPHTMCNSALSEIRVKTGWIAGSSGFSFRVMKGVSYRIGGSRGHITRENELVETTRGVLILTNKRLFLHPSGNTKAVSIPVNKILSYKCYDDGVVIYKEGREKPFVFLVDYPGEAEIIGICLGFLCSGY